MAYDHLAASRAKAAMGHHGMGDTNMSGMGGGLNPTGGMGYMGQAQTGYMGQMGGMGHTGQLGGGTQSNFPNPYANQQFANNLLHGVMSALGQMGGGHMGEAGMNNNPDPFNNMHSHFQNRPTTFSPTTTNEERKLSIGCR